MGELDTYAEAIEFLTMRATLAAKGADDAHGLWFASGGAPGTFAAWNDALDQQQRVTSALYYLGETAAAIFGEGATGEALYGNRNDNGDPRPQG